MSARPFAAIGSNYDNDGARSVCISYPGALRIAVCSYRSVLRSLTSLVEAHRLLGYATGDLDTNHFQVVLGPPSFHSCSHRIVLTLVQSAYSDDLLWGRAHRSRMGIQWISQHVVPTVHYQNCSDGHSEAGAGSSNDLPRTVANPHRDEARDARRSGQPRPQPVGGTAIPEHMPCGGSHHSPSGHDAERTRHSQLLPEEFLENNLHD